MEFYEKGIFLSLLFIITTLVIMKVVLMNAGRKVNWLYGWGQDYNQFKELAAVEADNDKKLKYTALVNILRVSTAALVASGVIGFIASRPV